jgi:hypothetical protein
MIKVRGWLIRQGDTVKLKDCPWIKVSDITPISGGEFTVKGVDLAGGRRHAVVEADETVDLAYPSEIPSHGDDLFL